MGRRGRWFHHREDRGCRSRDQQAFALYLPAPQRHAGTEGFRSAARGARTFPR